MYGGTYLNESREWGRLNMISTNNQIPQELKKNIKLIFMIEEDNFFHGHGG